VDVAQAVPLDDALPEIADAPAPRENIFG